MSRYAYATQPPPADRLRVLFLTTWYPHPENPVNGIFIREHARAASIIDDLTVIHLAGHDRKLRRIWQMVPETDEALAQGLRTYRFSHRLSPVPKTTYLLHLWGVFQAVNHLIRTDFRPDILHAHIYQAGLPALMIGRRHKIPVIVTEHSSAFPRRLLQKGDVLLARWVFSRADRVLPVSLALQDGIQRYGIHANFQIVPNVADTKLFTPPRPPTQRAEAFKLLFVGNLIQVKGLPYLLQALGELREHCSNWTLDVIGEGPERTSYEKIVQEYGLGEKIRFQGIKSKPEIAEFMRTADLFVLPSLWENLPCVLLEAMACGLPVLSTWIGGIPEIVSPDNGQLVPPGDSQALARALREMFAGGLLRFHRLEIAQQAQQFSPRAVGELLHSIYQDVLQK